LLDLLNEHVENNPQVNQPFENQMPVTNFDWIIILFEIYLIQLEKKENEIFLDLNFDELCFFLSTS
jgi:hypothetical protein